MVSYPAKGINKFTAVNRRLLASNRRGRILPLASLLSTGSRTGTARLLCSSRSGVTYHSPSAAQQRAGPATPANPTMVRNEPERGCRVTHGWPYTGQLNA